VPSLSYRDFLREVQRNLPDVYPVWSSATWRPYKKKSMYRDGRKCYVTICFEFDDERKAKAFSRRIGPPKDNLDKILTVALLEGRKTDRIGEARS